MRIPYDSLFTLRWFRDQGNGQVAADRTGARQLMDGSWPVAVLPCEGQEDADSKWWELLRDYQVNAMTYWPFKPQLSPVV